MGSHEIQGSGNQNSSVGRIFARKLAVGVVVQGMGAWKNIKSDPDKEAAIAHFINVIAGAGDVENPLDTLRNAAGFLYRGALGLRKASPLE